MRLPCRWTPLLVACVPATLLAAGSAPDPPVTAPAPEVEFLVVTDATLAPSFAPLVAERVARGIPAAIRTVEEIERAHPAGRDAPERIRGWLRVLHRRAGLRSVLLGGDTEIVPARFVRREPTPPFDDPVACDLYYAALDGTWDADGDGVFGEWADDDPDLAAELAIGRAPVRTAPEADAFVAKTLAFSAGTDAARRDRIVFFSEVVGSFDDWAVHSESMIAAVLDSSAAALDVVRRYENVAGWPGSLPLTRATALAELETGGHGLVVHLGVGECGALSVGDSALGVPDADALGNADPFVLLSAGTISPLEGDCVAERLLRNPAGGGVATLGSSGIAFVAPLLRVTRALLREVYVEGTREIGEAARRARNGLGPPFDRWAVTWTLLADPGLDVAPRPPAGTPLLAARAGPRPLLAPPRPNPLRLSTTIPLSLATAGRVVATVHDVRGRRVRRLADRVLPAGAHPLRWDGNDTGGRRVPAGVYFVRVASGGRTAAATVTVLARP